MAQTDWIHETIDSAPPGQPLDVRVQTPVMKGVKVFLFYRSLGQSEFTSVEMKRRGPEKVARIPAEAMQGKSVQYYLEAKDATNNLINHSGSQVDPNIIFLDASAAVRTVGDGGGAEECADGDESCKKAAVAAPVRKPRDDSAFDAPPGARNIAPPKPVKPPGPPVFSSLGWAGLGVAIGGVLVAGGGGALAALALQNAGTVATDASDTNCRKRLGGISAGAGTTAGLCFFNNPSEVLPTDYDYQNNGKTYALVSDILLGVGGAMVVGGVAMLAYDYVRMHKPANKGAKPAPAKGKKASAPLLRDFVLAPSVSPTSVGVGAGFRF
jgi:hypothetical protein